MRPRLAERRRAARDVHELWARGRGAERVFYRRVVRRPVVGPAIGDRRLPTRRRTRRTMGAAADDGQRRPRRPRNSSARGRRAGGRRTAAARGLTSSTSPDGSARARGSSRGPRPRPPSPSARRSRAARRAPGARGSSSARDRAPPRGSRGFRRATATWSWASPARYPTAPRPEFRQSFAEVFTNTPAGTLRILKAP